MTLRSLGLGLGSRYNPAMRLRIPVDVLSRSLVCLLMLAVTVLSGCTFFKEAPAKSMSQTTGGEGMERVFWKNVQAGNWVEVDRAIASNYSSETPSGELDRDAAIAQYRSWQLKDCSLGELKTELNGTTIVVTYTITLNGTVNGSSGSQPLPSTPQHMMTVWQQQKAGWVEIAHSVSQ